MYLFIYLFHYKDKRERGKYQSINSMRWPSEYRFKFYLFSRPVKLIQGKWMLSIFDQFVWNMQILDLKRLCGKRNEYFKF